jgi:hypothetical protein
VAAKALDAKSNETLNRMLLQNVADFMVFSPLSVVCDSLLQPSYLGSLKIC